MYLHVRKLCILLKNIRQITNMPIVLYYADSDIRSNIDKDLYYHRNCFCMAVMESKTRYNICVKEDMQDMVIKASKVKKPFLKRCHAGVLELVIPIISNKGYEGVIMFGPVTENKINPLQLSEYNDLPVYSEDNFKAVENLLSNIVKSYISQLETQFFNQSLKNIKDERIAEAVDFIDRNIKNKINAAIVASQATLSISRFLHLFHRETGLTYSDYVNKARMEMAKKLLCHTNLKIVDIAFEVGFCQESYFSNVFVKCNNISPAKYRKLYNKNVVSQP